MWTALVEEWPHAAPVDHLRTALRRCEYEVFATLDGSAYEATKFALGPLLRITPHPDDDACGHRAPHAAYSLSYGIPVLCRLPGTRCLQDTKDEAQLHRTCAHCLADLGIQGGPRPGRLPLAWRDLTPPQTLRAEAVPPETLLRDAHLAKQWRSSPPEPYRWKQLANDVFQWEEEHPAPTLSSADELALAGVQRQVALSQLAFADSEVRRLLRKTAADGVGPSRLEALSGVSRRTIPGWLRAEQQSAARRRYANDWSPRLPLPLYGEGRGRQGLRLDVYASLRRPAATCWRMAASEVRASVVRFPLMSAMTASIPVLRWK